MSFEAEDFQYETPPRIMGSETEYTTAFIGPDTDFLGSTPSRLVANTSSFGSADEGYRELWLKDGSRLYIDTNDLTEYATPECRNAHEVALHERSGEVLVNDIAATERTTHENGAKNFIANAYKRSGYSEVRINDELVLSPLSTGHHENYATAIAFNDLDESTLMSYLVSRGSWSGAGMVGLSGYLTSQKAGSIDFKGSSMTEEGAKRPYRIHSGSSINRLEIRTGEGNMSWWINVQKFALTSLVLRLIEHEKFPSSLLIRQGAETPSFRSSARLGKVALGDCLLSAARHQQYIAEAGLEFSKDFPDIPREEVDAAKNVIAVCKDIELIDEQFSGSELIHDRVDWAAKLSYMKKYGLEIQDLTTKNLTAVMHDLRWEDIDPYSSPSRRWYRKYQPKQPTAKDITHASVTPPATRASVRTQILTQSTRPFNFIDWDRCEVQGNTYSLPDPYEDEPYFLY